MSTAGLKKIRRRSSVIQLNVKVLRVTWTSTSKVPNKQPIYPAFWDMVLCFGYFGRTAILAASASKARKQMSLGRS